MYGREKPAENGVAVGFRVWDYKALKNDSNVFIFALALKQITICFCFQRQPCLFNYYS